MNADRFDTIIRGYGRSSRRQALRLVGGTALGATFSSLVGRDEASAKRDQNGRKYRPFGGKCLSPGATCGTKKGRGKGKGKKLKCCSGATCQEGTCQCPPGDIVAGKWCARHVICPGGIPQGCGGECCLPGQVCQGETTCVNGDGQPGDICYPEEPFTCQTGNCQCINNQCTCRQEACFGYGALCTKTAECCTGGCDSITNTCLPGKP